MGVGQHVRTQRLRAGKTQREIAKASGLAVSYLSRVENGRVTPSTRSLQRLAGALGTSVGALLTGDAPEHEPGERCPVSLCGRCILSHRLKGPHERARRSEGECEAYDRAMLETLRRCNALLQRGDERSEALRAVIESLSTLP